MLNDGARGKPESGAVPDRSLSANIDGVDRCAALVSIQVDRCFAIDAILT